MIAYIILIIFGLIIMFVMLSAKKMNKRLREKGERTEGIVHDVEYETVKGSSHKYPVIHFVTKERQSITKRTLESFMSSGMKKGSKVMVFYNPVNPQEFHVQSLKFNQMFITVLAGSLLFILTGIILILNELDVIHLFKK